MGKRSDFERIPKDFYRTWDKRAVPPLVRELPIKVNYYEPCAGEKDLIKQLDAFGHNCIGYSDISHGTDVFDLTKNDLPTNTDAIITNPPWSRKILHGIIDHCMNEFKKNTFLLFDADWAYTKQAAPYLEKYCRKIISVGRLKWIEDSPHDAKDNCAWYHFYPYRQLDNNGITFIERKFEEQDG